LQDDFHGRLYFVNKRWNSLQKLPDAHSQYARPPGSLGFGQLLTMLSYKTMTAFPRGPRRRLRNLLQRWEVKERR
jgi:hypothetical protein